MYLASVVLIFFFVLKNKNHRTFVQGHAGALKKVLCVLQSADRSQRLRHIVRTRDFADRPFARSAATPTPFGSSHLLFCFKKQKPLYFCTVVIAGALKKVLCVLQSADRSQRLRHIVRTRDFADRPFARSAATPTPFGSSHLLFCFKKQKPLYFCTVVIAGALKKIRTPDLLVRSQTLYPAELSAQMQFFKPP